MLQMGPAGNQGDFQIGDRGAGQNTAMDFFHQMGQDQALPVPVQHIRRAGGIKAQAGAAFAGLQKQMHLRVMPERLIMPDTGDGGGDGFPIQDAAGTEGNLHTETVPHQTAKDFQLHFAHELDMDFPLLALPDHMELGVFLLQDTEFG